MRPDRLTRPRRIAAARLGLLASLVALVAVPVSPAQAGITSPYVRKSIVTLAPGITWEKGVARTGSGIQAIQIARIDTRHPNVSLEALLSNDRVVKLERPSQNADRNSTAASRAMVATNGDVSTAGDWGAGAVMPSMHVHAGELAVATSCGRPTLGVDADGNARIGWVKNKLIFDMSNEIGWQGRLTMRGVNRPSRGNQMSLYTNTWGASTLTTSASVEVVLDPDGRITPNGELGMTVVAVRVGVHNSRIPAGKMVASGDGERGNYLRKLEPGDRVTIVTQVDQGSGNACGPTDIASGWQDVREAMGGNYFTALNGRNVAPSASKYPKGGVAAPRTNVGITADGTVLMVVVDGRQGGYSVGMNLVEMGQLMLSLGAVSAFNLDGGGSSVMATRKAGADHITVSNRPSDGRERYLTQALAAFSIAG